VLAPKPKLISVGRTPCCRTWVCRIFLAALCGGSPVCGIGPELARDCGWCLVSRYRFLVCKKSSATCIRDHLADRAADLGRRLGSRSGASRGYVARHFGSVDGGSKTFAVPTLLFPNADLRQRHSDELYPLAIRGRLIVKVGVAYGTDTRSGRSHSARDR